MKALAFSGGGIRGLASAGSIAAGVDCGFRLQDINAISGDSSGALIAALLASGWSVDAMLELLRDTDIASLLSQMPWSLRRGLILLKPLSLKALSDLIDSLELQAGPELFINSWDALENQQVIFCQKKPDWAREAEHVKLRWHENAFEDLGLGTIITRSMALPGLKADSKRWLDGAIGEHPPLDFLPDESELTLIDLGFAGLIDQKKDSYPKSLLARALYAYEVTASINQSRALERFHPFRWIRPKVYDVDSTQFGLSQKERTDLIERGYKATLNQWKRSL